MKTDEKHVVTGAFSYSGKYIAQRLLDAGHTVTTITNRPNRPDYFQGKVEVKPLDFSNHKQLVDSLRGAAVLYNTYWVRFNHATFSHSQAVANDSLPLHRRPESGDLCISASPTRRKLQIWSIFVGKGSSNGL